MTSADIFTSTPHTSSLSINHLSQYKKQTMNLRCLLLVAALPTATSFKPRHNRNNDITSLAFPKHLIPTNANELIIDDEVAAVHEIIAARGGDATSNNIDVPTLPELTGAAFFTLLQIGLTKLFTTKSITFPAMLGCTVLIFVTLVLAEAISPGLGDAAFTLLQPGSNLLTKWLPVMFVPGLAMLPLAPSIGSPVDVLKVLSMIVLGFTFTISSTGGLVLAMRKAQGLVVDTVVAPEPKKRGAAPAVAAAPPAKPFTEATSNFLLQATVLTGAISMAASRANNDYATPIRTVFMFFGTLFTYVFGARLPSSFTKIVHPLVTSTAGTLLLTQLDAAVTGSNFNDVLKTYKAGSLSPLKTGAGDILLFLLGPAVGCLSVAMYSRKQIMAENLPVVIAAMLCSSLGGIFGTAWYVRLLSIGSSTAVRLSLLSRNVTTALAIGKSLCRMDFNYSSQITVMFIHMVCFLHSISHSYYTNVGRRHGHSSKCSSPNRYLRCHRRQRHDGCLKHP